MESKGRKPQRGLQVERMRMTGLCNGMVHPSAVCMPGFSIKVRSRYVTPLLVRNRKFHVRSHVLVTRAACTTDDDEGLLEVWLHPVALALFSGKDYTEHKHQETAIQSRLFDSATHLTNHCVQVIHCTNKSISDAGSLFAATTG